MSGSHVRFQKAVFSAVSGISGLLNFRKTRLEIKKNTDLLPLPPKQGARPPSPKVISLSAIRQNNYPHKVGFRD